jgi:cytochrome c553
MNTMSYFSKIAAACIAALACTFAQAEIQGSASAGEKKAAMCIGCHGIVGYQSSFPQVHKVPMISGQSQPYIVSALISYQKGDRKHPTMKGIAAPLSEQDMADLAAFYTQHGAAAPAPPLASAPPANVAALLQKGACISCHGDNFSKPINPIYPKLAGQHSDYLYVALRAYQITGNPQVGRNHALMNGQAKMFSPAELQILADYVGSLPGDLKVVPQSRFRALGASESGLK